MCSPPWVLFTLVDDEETLNPEPETIVEEAGGWSPL